MTTNRTLANGYHAGEQSTPVPATTPTAAPTRSKKTRARKNPSKAPSNPARPAPKASHPDDHLARYAYAGVCLMAAMSAALNGYANSLHATIPAAGWAMGLAIPCIILLLGKVAGLLYRRGARTLAYATGATGAGLLLLSVWHCALSISLLTTGETGWGLLLALPMAVAIDAGFVCCEVAALVEDAR